MTLPSMSPGPRSADTSPAPLALHAWSGADLDAGLLEWRALEARLGEVPIACSHLWTSVWLRAYRDLVPATVLTATVDGVTVGAVLVTRGVGQKSGPVPLRTLHFGTAGEPLGQSVCVEYNSFLADRPHRPAMIAALREWVAAQKSIDEVHLDGWPEHELGEWTWSSEPNENRLRACRYFDLTKPAANNVAPIDLLGRSTRQNLRRILRKYGEIETTWADNLEDADDIFSELVTLHQARWQAVGQPGAFASERFTTFQRQLMVEGFADRRLVLFRARHQGQSIGCLMLLVDRGRLLDYLSGFASFEEKPSPGLVTHYLCLTEAAQRGFLAYDFLVGDKRHKDNLSTDVQQLAWVTWRRATVRTAAVSLLRRVKSALKRRPAQACRLRNSPAKARKPARQIRPLLRSSPVSPW